MPLAGCPLNSHSDSVSSYVHWPCSSWLDATGVSSLVFEVLKSTLWWWTWSEAWDRRRVQDLCAQQTVVIHHLFAWSASSLCCVRSLMPTVLRHLCRQPVHDGFHSFFIIIMMMNFNQLIHYRAASVDANFFVGTVSCRRLSVCSCLR